MPPSAFSNFLFSWPILTSNSARHRMRRRGPSSPHQLHSQTRQQLSSPHLHPLMMPPPPRQTDRASIVLCPRVHSRNQVVLLCFGRTQQRKPEVLLIIIHPIINNRRYNDLLIINNNYSHRHYRRRRNPRLVLMLNLLLITLLRISRCIINPNDPYTTRTMNLEQV